MVIMKQIIPFFCLIAFVISSENTLQLLHILYRHGARTPVDFYHNDPYKNLTYWPQGLGQLTKTGKAMEYKLGSWLRNRYGNFISKDFNPNEIHVVSTDYDRTLMSAQCVLASFYYPDNDIRFNTSIPWMPVPIHTSPAGSDKLINVDSTCPRIAHEMAIMHQLPEIIKYHDDRKELFDKMTEYAGDDRSTIREIADLYDTLFIESNHNLSVPSWAHSNFQEMRDVSGFSFKINAFTRELKRLRGGPLIRQITTNMEKFNNSQESEKKLYMYSAHDSTVAIVLNSLGVFNTMNPPYAATVLIELHKIKGEQYVKLFYRNDTNIEKEPYLLSIPGCDVLCPLTKWRHLLNDVIPDNWEKECFIRDSANDAYAIKVLTGLLMMIVTLSLLISTLCLYFYWRNRSLHHITYTRIEPAHLNFPNANLPRKQSSNYGAV